MSGLLFLCNSIGVNFGYPEPEFFRAATLFSLKGYRIILDDLRIRVYSEIRDLVERNGIRTVSVSSGSQVLRHRIDTEEINGTIEDYLDCAAYVMLNEEAVDSETFGIPIDTNTLESTIMIIRKECAMLLERAASAMPSMACFFLMPRKVRETFKDYDLMVYSEFLFPLFLMNELKTHAPCHFVIACETNSSSLIDRYASLKESLPKLTFIHHHITSTLEKLFRALVKKEEKLPSIPGTIYYDGNDFRVTEPDVESEPDYIVPDYSMIDRRYFTFISNPPQVVVDGSKGCPLHCSFCNVSFIVGPYRPRAGIDIARELVHYHTTLYSSMAIVNDRIFNTDMRRLNEFIEHLIDHDYKGVWCCYMMFRKEMTLDVLKKISKTRCISISYGLESASPRVLRRMRKNFSPRLASRIIKDTYDAGISIQLSVMTDFPGEEEVDFQKTLNFIERHYHYIREFRLNQFEAYRGCDVQLHPEAYGLTQEALETEFEGSIRLQRMREFILELENRSVLEKK